MRIIAGTTGGIGDGDIVHGGDCPLPGFPLFHVGVRGYGLGDLLAHAHHRIQGGQRFLKDHGDPQTAEAVHIVLGNAQQIEWRALPVAESNFSGGFGLRR